MLIRDLEVQRIIDSQFLPADEELQLWLEAALIDYSHDAEVLIRIVDSQEITSLNKQYRHKTGSTNILSFPLEMIEGVPGLYILGDLVICAEVLEREAREQKKTLNEHWAHIVIHGILHLIGFDHINEKDATEMEAKEINVLHQLQIDNPYQEKEVNG